MNKKIKRLLALGLCVSMLAMTACNGNKKPANDDKNQVELDTNSVKRPIDYGKKQDPLKFSGSEVFESDIYVAPVKGITDDFMRGVDVSSYIAEKDSGVKYYDFEGNELDDAGFFRFLAECGVNWCRIRVWNDPYDKDGMGYGGGTNDVDKAMAIGKLATNAGMKVLIDFHYSDFWADPAKQQAPKEWAHKTYDDKKAALAQFTKDSLKRIMDFGVDVAMVQVGNETNNGMAGESSTSNEARVLELIKVGCDAVREVSKDIKIAVHYTNIHENGFPDFCGKLINAGADFDIFGASYYPFWHGTLEKMQSQLEKVKTTYNKDVMVVETSYIYTDKNGDGHSNSVNPDTEGVEIPYDVSVQGQANEVRDIMQAVVNAGGLGVFYWEPAWIPVKYYAEDDPDAAAKYEENMKIWEENGSGWAQSYAGKYDPKDAGVYYGGSAWDNQALFDFEGHPMQSLNVFKYVFSGTNAKNAISAVNDFTYESGISSALKMPETVAAIMLDGTVEQIPVVWDAAQVGAVDVNKAGLYTVTGKATGDGKEFNVTCTVDIKKINYVLDPSFEDATMSNWNIETTGTNENKPTPSRQEDNNKKTGKACLHFFSSSAFDYTVTQKITNIPAGKYELRGNIQGGDAASGVFELFIQVNGVEYKASLGVKGWQQWSEGIVSNVEIPEGAEVVVGMRAKVPAKGWGAWDDLTLYVMD